MSYPKVLGPLVVSADRQAQFRFLVDGFGLSPGVAVELDRQTLRDALALDAEGAWLQYFSRPETGTGVTLLCPEPAPERSIRGDTQATDTDALKVIDFACADIEAASERLRALGFSPGSPARYPMPEGPIVAEAHLAGPDDITCALLQIEDAALAAQFSRLPEEDIGDIIACSAPVLDTKAVTEFYEQQLGLRNVYEYRVQSAAFSDMIGADEPVNLVGLNFGTNTRDQYIGIIDYGLPAGLQSSLAGRANLAHRGVAALRIQVDSLAQVLGRVRTDQVLSGPALLADTTVALVRAPHGVLHLLEQAA